MWVLERMRQRGELRQEAEPVVLAAGLLASIEGGMALSQARKDIASLRIAVDAGLGRYGHIWADSVLSRPLPASSRTVSIRPVPEIAVSCGC